jgi:aspartate/methionine/tyrosine aminotransferase
MEWAKARTPGPRFHLAGSGAPSLAPADLDLAVDDLRMKVRGGYGDLDLLDALATRYGVPEEEIVPTIGSSLANWLTVATLVSPGDTVLVETPCYESLATLPRLLGAEVRPVPRREVDGWALPVEALERGFADGARLAVVTDSHNPSGVAAGDEHLARVARAAEAADAWLLVDEVYRDFRPGPVSTTRRLGARVLATSSLTKVYGLGGLRVGWVLAPADLAADLHRHQDYLGVECPGPSASIAVAAWPRLDAIRERHRKLGARGWEIVRDWMRERGDLSAVEPAPGLIAFLRLEGDVDTAALVRGLEERDETTVVPGEQFGRPGYLRLGFGLPEAILREGLLRIGSAIDAIR